MTDTATNDRLTRFLIEGAGVRGVHVRLDDTWQEIRARADCLPSAAPWLGEAAAASALFTGHAKVDGRLSVQLRGHGTLRTLFAECTAAGTLRGIVQLAEDGGEVERELRDLHDAVLAITIENPARGSRDPMRYQGLVALDADTLAGAFEDYFVRSEQLPTRLLLVADERGAAGLMLQKLPGDEGDEDGWNRASALFDTLTPGELLSVPVADLTHRLFHEDGARLLDERPLRFACSCSRARVESMLVSLGPDEARAAVQDDGLAQVRCEFCGESYRFDAAQIEALFSQADAQVPPPDRLQ